MRLLCSLWTAIALHGQALPDLRPPAQTYIYDFDGTSAAAPVAPALNLGATFSIEFWMMLNRDSVDPEFMRVFQKEAGLQLEIDRGTHELSYSQMTAEPNSFRGAHIGVSLTAARWYHVAVVSNNLQVTLYLNGQQQATMTAAGPPAVNTSPWVLSGQVFGKKDGTEVCCGFPGSLRQFRMWSRALSTSDVASVATKVLTGVCHECELKLAELHRRWEKASRSRLSGADSKPPGAAAFKRRGGERPRKRRLRRTSGER